ncbi:hypothetical protein A4X09_0g2657 [Tilletia walkeri]|uniref:Nucleolar protein 9 n=1 Tax=Tilletia walkeri TaxID=117179 RepID=A0A8X7NC03_9BASI|nr:hypothetical protein A4X09_0g2657 [Tilletia walkeri]
MPRENKVRQRGKKKSKQQVDGEHEHEQQQPEQQPDWILSQQEHEQRQQQQQGQEGQGQPAHDDFDASTPFGLVAPEIKTYFKTAHADLVAAGRNNRSSAYTDIEEEEGGDSEQHQLLLNAALQELSGHELALATDPDTSIVLEYIIDRINPTQLRVLADRLSGSLFILATHRFGSHVVEAILASLQRILAFRASSLKIASSAPSSSSSSGDVGTLRTASQLILDYASELKESQQDAVSTLLHHQFGTHILRTLFSILSGRSLDSDSSGQTRSKRSAAFRQKEGVSASDKKGKSKASGFTDGSAEHDSVVLPVPAEFPALLQGLLSDLTATLGINEVRALSHNVIAAPTLGLALALELPPADEDLPVGRLADLLLDNIPSTCATFLASQSENKKKKKSKKGQAGSDALVLPPTPERSDHMESALRDPIASHLIQRVLELLAERVRAAEPGSLKESVALATGRLFWRTYFLGRTVNLALHPTANYIVQSCVTLLGSQGQDVDAEEDDLRSAIAELQSSGKKLIKASMAPLPTPKKGKSGGKGSASQHVKTENRTGVLNAVLVRAGHLGSQGYEADAVRAILTSFGFGEDADGDAKQDEEEDGIKEKKKKKKSKKGKGEDGQEGIVEGDDQEGKKQTSEKDDAERKAALIVPCIISMRSRKAYERILKQSLSGAGKADKDAEEGGEEKDDQEQEQEDEKEEEGDDPSLALGLQASPASLYGSVILQSMLKTEASASETVYHSLLHPLNGLELLRSLAQSAAGMHVLVTALGSATATFKNRTALFRAVLPILVDITVGENGKWGSRVADACWDWADPFFKDKIAAEALRRERNLLSSTFGKFFLRRVNVGLYRRDPRKWKEELTRTVERKGWLPGLAEEWENQRKEARLALEAGAATITEDAEVPSASNGQANGNGAEKTTTEKKRKEKPGEEAEDGEGKTKKKRKRDASTLELDSILSMIPG